MICTWKCVFILNEYYLLTDSVEDGMEDINWVCMHSIERIELKSYPD